MLHDFFCSQAKWASICNYHIVPPKVVQPRTSSLSGALSFHKKFNCLGYVLLEDRTPAKEQLRTYLPSREPHTYNLCHPSEWKRFQASPGGIIERRSLLAEVNFFWKFGSKLWHWQTSLYNKKPLSSIPNASIYSSGNWSAIYLSPTHTSC